MTPPRRPIVLTLAGHYLPGFRAGGPIRSLVNLVQSLGREFHFHIVAYDRDLGSEERYPGVTSGWMEVAGAQVRYIDPKHGVTRALASLIRHENYDVLYLQTFFDPWFGMLPLLLRRFGLIRATPVVIAPRGQFSPGAFAIHRTRKRLYVHMSRLLLRGDEVWQATAASEEEDIRRHFEKVRIVVAPNVPPRPAPMRERAGKRPGRLRIVFLSRVSRKKNLDGALKALAGLVGDIQFDVYGPIEDETYWKECLEIAESLASSGVRLLHRGAIEPELVPAALSEYDLFFFPTHGENFGHVILEALLAGCPSLLSDQTPWRGLEAAGAGWDIPLTEQARVTEAVRWCLDADEAALGERSRGARAFGMAYLEQDDAVNASRALLTAAIGH